MKYEITHNGRQIGYVICSVWDSSQRILFASSIVIHEKHRGKGFFKVFITKLKELAICQGCNEILLEPGDPLGLCKTPETHQAYIEYLKTIYAAKGFKEDGGLMSLSVGAQ